MRDNGTLDWLLVGSGDIAGKRVAEALATATGSRLSAVCDLDESRAAAVAGRFGAGEVYADVEQALQETSATAVYVATPVFLHSEFACKALQSGRHVLVEKPLGLNAEDAKRAVAAADASGLCAGCSYYRRFMPRYDLAAKMLAAGTFGRIVLVRMTYFSWFDPDRADPKYWRVVPEKGGGGPLADMGTHMFDVLIGLLGMPVNVYARVQTQTHAYPAEDSAAVLMQLDNGADVAATFNWNSRTWSHEFEIIGTEAKLKWHPYDTGPIIKTVGRDIEEIDSPNADNLHLPLVQDFVNAVHDGRAPAASLHEALKTNTLLDAVYESARKEATVTLGD